MSVRAVLLGLLLMPSARVAAQPFQPEDVFADTVRWSPLGQSEQLYHALRLRGVDTALVQFPGGVGKRDAQLAPASLLHQAQIVTEQQR